LNSIPDRPSDDPNVSYYLLFLEFIIHNNSEYTINMVKDKFLAELERMYNDPRFETNPTPLSLLLRLHEYSEAYFMKIIEDASSIDRWSDEQFQSLVACIVLKELEARNKEAYNRVTQFILRKMDNAERINDEKTLERLKILYNQL
jgi:hypothetical protein